LVAILDRAEPVANHRVIDGQGADAGSETSGAMGLGIAGPHDEPIRPRIKALRVAKLGEVPPNRQQRLLSGVLGEVQITQDAVGQGMEPPTGGESKASERRFIALLGPDNELGIHVPPPLRPWVGRS
jgi:hypothetical protein